MNLSIVSAKYVAPLKVELHFNDGIIKTVDVGAFIRKHPHPQYNSYLNENKFKKINYMQAFATEQEEGVL